MAKPLIIFICFFYLSGFLNLKAQQEDKVFVMVEVPPEFPGGDNAMLEFFSDNSFFVEKPVSKSINGVIFVQFIIETDGSVSNVKILKGLNPEVDEKLVKVISMMPKWTPGTQNGENVRVSFNIPVKFALSNK